MRREIPRFAILLLILALLSACAAAAEAPAENTPAPTATPEPAPDAEQQLLDMFGSGCMTEYIQQLTLDGFDGEVWFVPYRPSKPYRPFNAHVYAYIMQNGEVLAQLNSRTHDGYGVEDFSGLDSVAFRDLNGDGKTDIVMVECFGDERFVSLFFSTSLDTDDPEWRFDRDDYLGRALESRAAICSVPLTAEWAADMVRIGPYGYVELSNWSGEFDDWQTAYRTVAEQYARDYPPSKEETWTSGYGLMDIDGDCIPELATGIDGIFLRLYTYRGGALYKLMEGAYGAGGNYGYEYLPGENTIRNVNSACGGLLWILNFLHIDSDCRLDGSRLSIFYLADLNGNGFLDEADGEVERWEPNYIDQNGNGEYDDGEPVNVTFVLDGEEISEEEALPYTDGRGYNPIRTSLSFDELMTLIDGYGPG